MISSLGLWASELRNTYDSLNRQSWDVSMYSVEKKVGHWHQTKGKADPWMERERLFIILPPDLWLRKGGTTPSVVCWSHTLSKHYVWTGDRHLGYWLTVWSKSLPVPPPPHDWKTCQWGVKLMQLWFQNQYAQMRGLMGAVMSVRSSMGSSAASPSNLWVRGSHESLMSTWSPSPAGSSHLQALLRGHLEAVPIVEETEVYTLDEWLLRLSSGLHMQAHTHSLAPAYIGAHTAFPGSTGSLDSLTSHHSNWTSILARSKSQNQYCPVKSKLVLGEPGGWKMCAYQF